MLFSSAFGRELPVGSVSPSPNWSLRIWEVADRKSASSSISSPPTCAAVEPEPVWIDPRSGICGEGLDATGAAASSLFKTIALKVPVAAVHSGFGGGSTKTWLTSAAGLNSSAASGMESSSSISARIEAGGGFGAGGGAAEEGCGRAPGAGGLVNCGCPGFAAAVSCGVGVRFEGPPVAGACCGRVGTAGEALCCDGRAPPSEGLGCAGLPCTPAGSGVAGA